MCLQNLQCAGKHCMQHLHALLDVMPACLPACLLLQREQGHQRRSVALLGALTATVLSTLHLTGKCLVSLLFFYLQCEQGQPRRHEAASSGRWAATANTSSPTLH
jgi:hypothetical protein